MKIKISLRALMRLAARRGVRVGQSKSDHNILVMTLRDQKFGFYDTKANLFSVYDESWENLILKKEKDACKV